MSINISIILCTYNEGKYIQNTVAELEKNIPNVEIVIVDDDSTDGTIEIIKNINHSNKYKVIYRKKSRSLASAFVRGIAETSGNYIGWVDTNMSEVIQNFPKMIKELSAETDIVVLSRYVKGGADNRVFLRRLSSKYFNILCGILLRSPIKDFTSSIFLMKRKVLDEVTFLGYGHGEFFLEFLHNAFKKGFKIKEIPYTQNKDEDISNSKSASSLPKFLYLGFMYFLRIVSTLIRTKN